MHIRNAQRYKAMVSVSAACIVLAMQALAADVTSEEYLRQQGQSQRENWFGQQLHVYRSFRHLDRAQRMMDNGRMEEAQSELETYLKNDPNDLNVQIAYLALLHRERKFYELVRYADPLLVKQPGLYGGLLYRGLAQQALGVRNKALADFRAAASVPSIPATDRRFALNMVADLALEDHNVDVALQALNDLLPMEPTFAVQFRRALALGSLTRHAEADAAFAAALRLAEDDGARARVHRARGEQAASARQWDEARTAARGALALDPNHHADLPRHLSDVAYQQGNNTEAIYWARNALAGQDSVDTRRFLANLLIKVGDHEAAVSELERLLTAASGSAKVDTLMSLGYELVALKQFDRAASMFKAATDLEPTATTLTALLEAQQSAGRWQAVRSTAQRLAKVAPSASLMLRQALLEARAGHDRQAINLLEQVESASLSRDERISQYRQLGTLYGKQKRWRNAAKAYERLLSIDPAGYEVLLMLGNVSMQRHMPTQAADYYRQSIARGGGIDSMRGLATAAYSMHDLTASANAWERILHHPKLTLAQRAEVNRNLGYIYTELGKDARAQHAFTRALALPGDRARVERSLGIVLSKQGRWAEALPHFERAHAARPEPVTQLYLARSNAALKNIDAAITHFEQALMQRTGIPLAEEQAANAELSVLYHLRGKNERSIEYAQRALTMRYDPHLALQLGHAQRVSGNSSAARETLERIPAGSLSAKQEAERQDELSRIYATEHDFLNAAKSQAVALDANYSTDREYQLGVYRRQQGDVVSAVQHWENAAKIAPNNSLYAKTLAYAYATAGRDRDMAQILERLVQTDPYDSATPSELGYAYLRNGETQRAANAFRTAIERHGSRSRAGFDSTDNDARDQFRLRQEVNQLTNYFDFTVYESFRTGQGRVGTPASGLAGGVIPSQGGVELAYQPPGIGLKNGRIFQLYTRLLWSNEPDSLSIEDNSVQGGIGIRYKPLSSHNLFFGAEKLYRVGANALDGWLMRAAYGWSQGVDLDFDSSMRHYTYLYGDVGYVTGRRDFVAFYGEGREGMSFQPWANSVISPHVVLDGRVQTEDADRISYFEGGAGVAFKLYFNRGYYEGYRSNFELLLQYKAGIVNVQDSLVATGILRF